MALGDVILERYGPGGYLPDEPNDNLTERHVVTSVDGDAETITILDGAGQPTGETYERLTDQSSGTPDDPLASLQAQVDTLTAALAQATTLSMVRKAAQQAQSA